VLPVILCLASVAQPVVPRVPVNVVNEAVYAGDSKDARFVFDLLALPQTLEVGIFNGKDSAKVALSLDSLARR
jgi:hypothetical protein